MAVTSISLARNARISGLTSSPVTRKSPVIAALAAAGGLEVDGVGAAHRSGDLEPHLHDGIAARDAELVHAAVGGALDADDFIELAVSRSIAGGAGGLAAGGSNGVLLAASADRMTAAIFSGSPCPPTCM